MLFPPSSPLRLRVPPERAGARLDEVLAEVLPGYGRRAWRRLWRLRRVLLNGRPGRPGRRVRAGDEVRLERPPGEAPLAVGPCALVALGSGYAALRKPAGLHTARLAGGAAASFEEFLALHWADLWRSRQPDAPVPPPPRLVTRLDRETSGLLLGLMDAALAAEEDFRSLEREGGVEKIYLGLAHGAVRGPLLIRAGLETRKRRRTKVLPLPDSDATRHTRVTPLRLLDGAFLRRKGILGEEAAQALLKRPFTLIRARILRGSRHQIRAHLAGAGFPLLGDPLYGEGSDGAGRLYLHHAAISLPGFFALDPPDWELGGELEENAAGSGLSPEPRRGAYLFKGVPPVLGSRGWRENKI